MLLDGNNMIELLALPEWDDRVLDMLEEFGEKRPVLGLDDIDVFIIPDGYGVRLMFDEECLSEEQLKHKGESNLYLNQIAVDKGSPIQLPFNLEFNDSYEVMSQKMGRVPDFRNKNYKEKFNWLLGDESKKYFLHIKFEDESLQKCKGFYLDLFDKDIDYSLGTEKNI